MKGHSSLAFTLVELMIAGLITAVISTAIYKIIRSQARSQGDQLKASQNLRNAQRVRALLTDDITQAGFDPRYVDLGRPQITPFTIASNDRFAVQGDYNLSGTVGDQTPSQDPEIVTYLFDAASNQVTRNGNPVLTNVSNFSATYFDTNGNSSSSVPGGSINALNRIKKVRISWTQSGESGGDQKEEVVVVLRNYK
jgi:Tfp pilus assembly protein PilW